MVTTYLYLIAAVGLLSACMLKGYTVVTTYKKGTDNVFTLLGKIKDLAIEFCHDALELKLAEDNGFESIKQYVINKIMLVIEADGITEFEAKYLTRANIELFVTPLLEQLVKYRINLPKETDATLRNLSEFLEQ